MSSQISPLEVVTAVTTSLTKNAVTALRIKFVWEASACSPRKRKAEAETNAEKVARLKREAPDLADLSGMSLDEAMAKLEQRQADEAKLASIKDEAPDLVALVREVRMSRAGCDGCAQ